MENTTMRFLLLTAVCLSLLFCASPVCAEDNWSPWTFTSAASAKVLPSGCSCGPNCDCVGCTGDCFTQRPASSSAADPFDQEACRRGSHRVATDAVDTGSRGLVATTCYAGDLAPTYSYVQPAAQPAQTYYYTTSAYQPQVYYYSSGGCSGPNCGVGSYVSYGGFTASGDCGPNGCGISAGSSGGCGPNGCSTGGARFGIFRGRR
jgi:hypothetical protein